MAQEAQATTWALFQCEFSAPSPKPTPFLSTLTQTSTRVFPGWPSFDSKRRYLGLLPAKCGHTWHVRKLIGKHKGAWATAASAAYPPRLCHVLATLIASRLGKTDHSQTGQESMLVDEVQQMRTVEPQVPLTQTNSGDQAQDQLNPLVDGPAPMESEEMPGETTERMSDQPASTTADASHRGTVIEVEWGGRKRQIVDGFGLCSANRWQPEDRGAFLEPEVKNFVTTLKNLVEEFVVSQVGDLRKASIQLVLGKLKNSPFSEEALTTLRTKWARLLPSAHTALQVPEGQPFFLHLAAQTLERIKDPDYRVLVQGKDSFAEGAPVGYDEPLPRTPDVFPPKERHRKLDESEFLPFAENYKSAESMSNELAEKFAEKESLGRMFPTTLGELKTRFPGREILVAAMGAIKKPNGDVRPLHDGTHHVRLNNNIVFQDQLQYSGPEDAAALVREVTERREAMFTLAADIKSAHRLVKIRQWDWPLLGCKSSSSSKVIWVNRCGAFGVSSASYWWTRLFGALGRLVITIMSQELLFQLVYVDDLHMTLFGERKFLNLWMTLAMYEALGTPFGYHKFGGGLEVQFVGFQLDYKGCKLWRDLETWAMVAGLHTGIRESQVYHPYA